VLIFSPQSFVWLLALYTWIYADENRDWQQHANLGRQVSRVSMASDLEKVLCLILHDNF